MTQKQTDYEQTLMECKKEYIFSDRENLSDKDQMMNFAFLKGYEYGKLSLNASKYMTLDHFRDSTKMMRYEIAKSMLAAFLSNSSSNVYIGSFKEQAQNAVGYADALIKELEKEKE